jgi:hypothetical protein
MFNGKRLVSVGGENLQIKAFGHVAIMIRQSGLMKTWSAETPSNSEK